MMPQITQDIALKDRYLKQLIKIFETVIDGESVELFLYGSRATGSHDKTSDIDLAVISSQLSPFTLSKLREALHESHIPYKMDLIDFNKAHESLRHDILNEGVLI